MKELLTGKCETDFEKWFNGNVTKEDEQYNWYLEKFYDLHASMQWGVLVDFFDSVQMRIIIDLYIERMINQDYDLYIEIEQDGFCHFGKFQTRPEARIEAIKESVKIYNNR